MEKQKFTVSLHTTQTQVKTNLKITQRKTKFFSETCRQYYYKIQSKPTNCKRIIYYKNRVVLRQIQTVLYIRYNIYLLQYNTSLQIVFAAVPCHMENLGKRRIIDSVSGSHELGKNGFRILDHGMYFNHVVFFAPTALLVVDPTYNTHHIY